jgi:N-acetylmuramoyl-L-alanine amidase
MRLSKYPWIPAAKRGSRNNTPIELFVFHYTAGRGDETALGKLFSTGIRPASAHFGVGRTGGVAQYVDTDRDAWHAGTSSFMGKAPVGDRSIGIEICNAGWRGKGFEGAHRNPRCKALEWESYRPAQIEALHVLCTELIEAHPTLRYITGHEDIQNPGTAPVRGSKVDPGPAFPWHAFTDLGLTIMQWDFATKQWKEGPL